VTRAPALRATALLALGGFAVHQARYALVPDPHGAVAHGYLAAAPVVLALLLAAALGRTLLAPARGRRWTWLGAGGALLALHLAQEGAERVLSGGGPVDLGLLLVVPLCLVAGWLVALALRGSEELAAAALPAAPRARRVPLAVIAPAQPAPALARANVARHLAGRAPPALV
jgi:hypothetical protein